MNVLPGLRERQNCLPHKFKHIVELIRFRRTINEAHAQSAQQFSSAVPLRVTLTKDIREMQRPHRHKFMRKRLQNRKKQRRAILLLLTPQHQLVHRKIVGARGNSRQNPVESRRIQRHVRPDTDALPRNFRPNAAREHLKIRRNRKYRRVAVLMELTYG